MKYFYSLAVYSGGKIIDKNNINEFNKSVLGMNKIRDFLLALDRQPPQCEQAKAQAIEELDDLCENVRQQISKVKKMTINILAE